MLHARARFVRGRPLTALAVCIALATAAPAPAQPLLPGLPETDGRVNAIAVVGDIAYVGGGFSMLGRWSGSGGAVNLTDGAPFPDNPGVAGAADNGIVFAAESDGAGGWFIGGIFTSVGGQPRQNLAHVAADRSVTSWNPGANAPVRALLRAGTTLYVGGDFSSIGGQSRTRLAALDTGTGVPSGWDPGASDPVQALALSGTTLYVGGSFNTLAGQPRSLVGAVDTGTGAATTWAPSITGYWVTTISLGATVAYIGGEFSQVNASPRANAGAVSLATGATTSWAPDPNWRVSAIVLNGSDVYVGGDFSTIGGRSRTGLAKVNDSNGNASTWNAQCDGSVNAMQLSGTTLYVAGQFTALAGGARRNAGAVDLVGPTLQAWNPSSNGGIECLRISGSNAWLGGNFGLLGASPRANLAAVHLPDGAITSWNPGTDGEVLALAQDGSRLYAGGWFSNIGGVTRKALASFDLPDGGLGALDAAINVGDAQVPNVRMLLADGSRLLLGGQFSTVLGASRTNLAAITIPDGALDPWLPQPNLPVASLAWHPDGVFVAGDFTTIGGASREGLAQVDATSGAATGWTPPVFFGGYKFGGTYVGPRLLAVNSDGDALYVGGSFSAAGGQGRANAAKLDATTGAVLAWDPPGSWNSDSYSGVRAFETAGSTVMEGGFVPFVNSVMALDKVSGDLLGWVPTINGTVVALDRWREYVLVGGQFAAVGSAHAGGLAAIADPGVVGADPPVAADHAGLVGPWPNPIRTLGRVALTLPRAARVDVRLFDAAGRLVRLVQPARTLGAGRHVFEIPIAGLPPGLYLVAAQAGPRRFATKLVVAR